MRIATLLILLPCLAMAVLALTAEAEEAPKPAMDMKAIDLSWQTVNDGVMGGRSRGGFARTDGRLVFAGSTNTNGGGFSSLRASLPARLDLSKADGIEMRVKGDGRTYTLMLRTNARYYGRSLIWYRTDFKTKKDTWTTVRVPLERFQPRWRGRALRGPALEKSQISGLGLMIYDKRDGPFRLEVEGIKSYSSEPAFDLTTLKWKKRPLLVFAPTAKDMRLERQLAGIKAAKAGFDERDMALIVIVAEGQSTIDGRPLRAEDARAIRARYDILDRAFAIRLIGKDGGVKRSLDRPIGMDQLYAQIDGMPMRKAEIARGSS
ncbi:MAG: CIA30 family protein [Planctomycetota bacterium]|nr:CIA30 family protein [Planctomycetota bacterium]